MNIEKWSVIMTRFINSIILQCWVLVHHCLLIKGHWVSWICNMYNYVKITITNFTLLYTILSWRKLYNSMSQSISSVGCLFRMSSIQYFTIKICLRHSKSTLFIIQQQIMVKNENCGVSFYCTSAILWNLDIHSSALSVSITLQLK